MRASGTQLFIFLQGQRHYIVPLFQRTYSWKQDDWETLWNDIIETSETYELGNQSRHFLGSVVTKSLPATPEGVSPFLVIDGQQRLTTLTLLLAALRDSVAPLDAQLADRIHRLYLTNEFAVDLGKYKVLPTQVDRNAYFAVIDGCTHELDGSRVIEGYRYFRRRLSEPGNDNVALDLKRLEQVIAGGLELVSITLEEPDNEYRIFESLNATGAPLTQADLLRNYFFMRLPVPQHDFAYSSYWLPMQERLGGDGQLEDFFRYEFMSNGEFVRQGDVYYEWKRRLDKKRPDELAEELATLADHSRSYQRLVDPAKEPNKEICERLTRLNRWGGQTMYPFLLYMYRQYDSGEADTAMVYETLRVIESFLVRRLFARVPTNTLNRLFIRLSQQLPTDQTLPGGVKAALSEPSRRWPRDAEFVQGFLTYPLYTDSRPDQRKLILESLETSYTNKERPPLSEFELTIEHVMPQNLTPEWRDDLGSSAEDVHTRLLHVVGNLTLTAYNPELSDKPFKDKRERLEKSNLEMNKLIAQELEWGETQITARGQELARQALHIWPGPIST
jgi:uncharacterized protein with ParB-like and HNH nuclease domain